MTCKSILSPLRYPGGKAGLFKFVVEVIRRNDRFGCSYYEPFAGGAGCALKLLAEGIVSRIVLNDADPCIYAFWQAALNETEEFIEKIHKTPLTVESWKIQKAIWKNHANERIFNIGFATFFLNRCNRSGIVDKSGPIGGFSQKGEWKIDARYNSQTLAERIKFIGLNKNEISIFNSDAIDFMQSNFTSRRNNSKFVYLDPPYYMTGKRLYFNTFNDEKHLHLSKFMKRQIKLKWLITYDNNSFIRKQYSSFRLYYYHLCYSLQNKQKAKELVVVPDNMNMPPGFSFDSKKIVIACSQ